MPTFLVAIGNNDDTRKFFFENQLFNSLENNLKDYQDLNKRYVKLADFNLFKDNKLTLDLFAKVYFKLAFAGLEEKTAFKNELLSGENLYKFIN